MKNENKLKEAESPAVAVDTVLVAVSEMLQYSENRWVMDCYRCGKELWFDLPNNGDVQSCGCGAGYEVSNCH